MFIQQISRKHRGQSTLSTISFNIAFPEPVIDKDRSLGDPIRKQSQEQGNRKD